MSKPRSDGESFWSAPRVVVAVTTLLATALVTWLVVRWFLDRPPVIERDNLRLVQLLHTAVSGRNPQHVDGVARAIDAKRKAGNLSDVEFDALNRILVVAREGDWERAQGMTFRLEQGQLNRSRPKVAPSLPHPPHPPGERRAQDHSHAHDH